VWDIAVLLVFAISMGNETADDFAFVFVLWQGMAAEDDPVALSPHLEHFDGITSAVRVWLGFWLGFWLEFWLRVWLRFWLRFWLEFWLGVWLGMQVMCPHTDYWHGVMKDTMLKIVNEVGFDGVYVDQVRGRLWYDSHWMHDNNNDDNESNLWRWYPSTRLATASSATALTQLTTTRSTEVRFGRRRSTAY
jgi:hypothetical protein